MSDDDSLLARFKKVFWHEYMHGLHSDLLSVSALSDNPTEALTRSLSSLRAAAIGGSIFPSKNEDLEDISSESLIFVILPFAIGDCLYNLTPFCRDDRTRLLQEVSALYEEYLEFCYQLCVLTKHSGSSSMDPRELKIADFKRQSSLKPSFARVYSVATLDDCRDELVDMMEYFGIQARSDLKYVQEEILALSHMSDPSSKPAQVSVPKPWTMKLDHSNIRSIAQKQVFRPDIAMPTMTMDEFAQIEMDRMRQASVKTPNTTVGDDDEETYSAEDARERMEHQKESEWDDWKDDNPRGAGNKMVNLG